jgi:hypothetical protein
MQTKFEDLLYQSGLTAQGSWDQLDEYDQQAIKRLFSLTVAACVGAVERSDHRDYVRTTFDQAQSQAFKQRTIKMLQTLLF